MSSQNEAKINQLIVDELGCDEAEVTPNARIVDDLGADSLDIVELGMRVEEEFSFDEEIPEDDMEKISTVKELYAYVEKRLAEGK